MPLYSFYCSSEHETSHLCKHEDLSRAIKCGVCGNEALYKISTSGPAKRNNNRSSDLSTVRGLRFTLHDFLCGDCDHVFEELLDREGGEEPSDGRNCPECGGDSRWVPTAKIDRFSEQFPYYDRGLGVMLKSKAHRREVCKQRGLTPVEGDWDIEGQYSKWDERVSREEKEYADYVDKLDNSPAFRNLRKQQDLGII